jgi:hypothetical protein
MERITDKIHKRKPLARVRINGHEVRTPTDFDTLGNTLGLVSSGGRVAEECIELTILDLKHLCRSKKTTATTFKMILGSRSDVLNESGSSRGRRITYMAEGRGGLLDLLGSVVVEVWVVGEVGLGGAVLDGKQHSLVC